MGPRLSVICRAEIARLERLPKSTAGVAFKAGENSLMETIHDNALHAGRLPSALESCQWIDQNRRSKLRDLILCYASLREA